MGGVILKGKYDKHIYVIYENVRSKIYNKDIEIKRK